jgi:competence protein ComEA
MDDLTVGLAARAGVAPRTVLGALLVALLVLGVLGARVAWVRSRSQPVDVAPASVTGPALAGSTGRKSAAAPATPTGAPGAVSSGAASSGTTPSRPLPSGSTSVGSTSVGSTSAGASGLVVVHVVGQVQRAGVVRLPTGSRVLDAVTAAGGPVRGADLAAVNLARVLVDGEQVVVPRPGQAPVPVSGAARSAGGSTTGSTGGSTAGSSGGSAGPIDLNAASESDLDALPGIGPVLAQRIVAWRGENGRFRVVDDLGEVSGIGDALLDRLRPLVRV